jgi:hypothetical protein
MNTLERVLTVAVNDGVRQGFTQSGLNVHIAVIRGSKLQNVPHELLYEWRDGLNLTPERLPQFNIWGRMKTVWDDIVSLYFSHVSDLQAEFPRHTHKQGTVRAKGQLRYLIDF